MAELPDFEQIARHICEEAKGSTQANIVTALRQVWNARGAEVDEARAEAERLHRLWLEARGQIERLETRLAAAIKEQGTGSMTEPPDFEQIATRIAASIPGVTTRGLLRGDIIEQLRQVWNARGAADAQAIAELGNYRLADAIKAQDR